MGDFIFEAENQIKNILNELEWNVDDTTKNSDIFKETCPNNEAHRIPAEKIHSHVEKCNWKSAGYNVDDIALPPAFGTGLSTLTLSPEKVEEIINIAAEGNPHFTRGRTGGKPRPWPETSNKYLELFTRDERLALYEHVIANTNRTKINEADLEFADSTKSDEKKELTAEELAAAQRDAKRRRATYRNKVHTGRKNYTEVLREVIDSQMTHMVGELTQRRDESRISNLSPSRRERRSREKSRKHKKEHKHKKKKHKRSRSSS